MNNAVFEITVENVRKYRDIKLETTNKRRNYLVSATNYHAKNLYLLAIEIYWQQKWKIKVKINKPVYLGLSILEIVKH